MDGRLHVNDGILHHLPSEVFNHVRRVVHGVRGLHLGGGCRRHRSLEDENRREAVREDDHAKKARGGGPHGGEAATAGLLFGAGGDATHVIRKVWRRIIFSCASLARVACCSCGCNINAFVGLVLLLFVYGTTRRSEVRIRLFVSPHRRALQSDGLEVVLTERVLEL